ncbi:hypothetical protein C1N92_13075 [Bacillus velezensis]|uniref:hypothetical protein n=1 Tax=Bacillus velezensis TaxID=492670 RepID=UPI000D73D43B|nr:hypothetical protein [Bacillus velezensis]AWQ15728.1 hypothetical protein C1N92_13075 [Bacillus velezensis]
MPINTFFDLIIIIFFFIILSFMLKIIKILKSIQKKPQTQPQAEEDQFTLREVSDQGIKNGSSIPSFTVINPVDNSEVKINSEMLKSTFLILTAVGCGDCQELLNNISIYNLTKLNKKVMILSFMPPEPIKIEKKELDEHFNIIKELSVVHYISSVKTLEELKFNQFPLIIPVDQNGQSLGTYHGEVEVILNKDFFS